MSRPTPRRPREAVAQSAAKINLVLKCASPQAGSVYHPLFTVFQSLDLLESVHFVPHSGEVDTVETELLVPSDITSAQLDNPDHLALRAWQLMRLRYDLPGHAHLKVKKRIPVAGGMAGGSADAAATLLAVNQSFDLGLSLAELAQLGADLGADVPACVLGGTSVATGFGNRVMPLPPLPPRHWVLLLSARGLSTPQVFAAADEHPQELSAELPSQLSPDQAAALSSPDFADFTTALENDLQPAAFRLRPDLAENAASITRRFGRDFKPLLSGSGPTLAVPVPDLGWAEKVREFAAQLPALAGVITVSSPAKYEATAQSSPYSQLKKRDAE